MLCSLIAPVPQPAPKIVVATYNIDDVIRPVTLDLSAELPVENVGAGVGASAGAGVHSEGGTEEKADVAAASI